MELQITQTEEILLVDGVPCRRWRGVTPGGVPCDVLVHRVLIPEGLSEAEFADLQAVDGPTKILTFAERLLLLYSLLSIGLPPAWQDREQELLGFILGGAAEQVAAAEAELMAKGLLHVGGTPDDATR